MNPVENFQLLRDFLHKREHNLHIRFLSQCDFKVMSSDQLGNEVEDMLATQIMKEFVGRFEELKLAFPAPQYNGTMDFVCELTDGDYAMIEMQVIPQNCWDRRALAYIAAFYGNQLKKGADWKDIRKVFGINILGGGKDRKVQWKDTPNQFMRNYKMQDQIHQPINVIDGLELIQYSIMNSSAKLPNQEIQDWVTFFKEGHFMTEEEVGATIKTPEVLEAFKKAKMKGLPNDVRLEYEKEDKQYARYSEHTEELVMERMSEVKEGIVINLINMKSLSNAEIAQATGLLETDIESLRQREM